MLGISWGLGARDVGMKAGLDAATRGLDDINRGIKEQSDLAGKSKVGGLFDRMAEGIKKGVKGFNLASIAGDVRELTGDTGNLTNNLEGMAVANAKAIKPLIAGMNLTGTEARRMTSRISGMAIGMNVGAESIATVFNTIHTATGPAKAAIDAFGYSEQDWVKITETSGLKLEELGDVMGGMGALWKADAASEVKFVNGLVEIGKKAGLGMAPLKGLKGNIEALGKPFEKLPPGMQRSGDEMIRLAESGTRMGGVFKELGSGQEEAVALGMQTANMFAEQAVALERAGMGLGSYEDSPLYVWMRSLGVSHEETMSTIQAGSRDVIQGMQGVQSVFQRFGGDTATQNAMLAELTRTLGEGANGLGYLAMNADAGGKALARMGAITVTGKNQLQAYGNQAFSSGRTLQDSFNMAQEAFDVQIRSIARADVVGLVRGKTGAFKEVAKEIKALGSDQTWGPLVKGMSMFKQMGIQGVLLQVGKSMGMNVEKAQKMSVKFGLVFDTLKDVGKELGPLMNILGQFGPLGIAAGGIAGFFMLDQQEQDAIWKTIGPIWEKVKEVGRTVWERMVQWFNETDFTPVKEGMKRLFTDAIPYIVSAVQSAFEIIASSIGPTGMALGGALAGAMVASKAFGPGGVIYGALIAGMFAAADAAIIQVRGIVDKMEYERKKQEELNAARQGGAVDKTLADVRAVAPLEKRVDYASMLSKDIGYTKAFISASEQKLSQEAYLKSERRKQELYDTPVIGTLAKTVGAAPVAALSNMFETQDQARASKLAVTSSAVGMADLMGQLAQIQHLPEVQEKLAGAMQAGGKGTFVTVAQEMVNTYYGSIDAINQRLVESGRMTADSLTGVFQGVSDKTLETGFSTAANFASGMTKATEEVLGPVAYDSAGVVANYFVGESPPPMGPLAGDATYYTGLSIMERFANGITDSTETVRLALDQTLNDSVMLTLDAYRTKVEEWSQQRSMLVGIAEQMVRDFGGGMQQRVEVEGQPVEDVKSTLKAALAIPGLAGVTAAIVNEGAKQRQILGKILEQSIKIAGGGGKGTAGGPELGGG